MKIGKATITPLAGGRVCITIGTQKTEIDYKELWGVVFVLGEGQYRDDMLPVQKKEMMVFSRKHVIEAQKDIKKGEKLNVWCEVNIPKIVVESIAEENGAKVIYQMPEVIPTPESTPSTVSDEKGVE